MTFICRIIFIGLFAFLVGCSATPSSTDPARMDMVDYFADNGLGNAVAVVQHPAGEYHDGVTYVTYQGPKEDPYIASYDHATKTWLGPFKAGVSKMGKDPNRRKKIDNHGKPTMIIDDAGYIHIFFGGHGGMDEHGPNPLGNKHYGENKHVVSKRPLDITEWEELDTLPPFGTYNQAVKMENGDIYLFYRHGAHRSDWVYQRSTDNGRSFAEPVSFLKHKRREDLSAVDSWYAWVGRGDGDDIIVSFDYHLCWDGNAARDERGHTTERHDLFYMVMDTSDGSWRNIEGERLSMPLIREEAEAKTLVADTGDLWTFNGSAKLDPEGRPHLAINMGEDMGLKTGGPKKTTHYRWTGTDWVGGTQIGKGNSSRGDMIVSSTTDVRFIATYRAGTDGVVSRWESRDGGQNFEETQELLRRDNASFAISTIFKNAHPDALMVVAERPAGTDDRRMYVIGENGPLQREKSDASQLD